MNSELPFRKIDHEIGKMLRQCYKEIKKKLMKKYQISGKQAANLLYKVITYGER